MTTHNLAELRRLLVAHCDFGELFQDDYQLGGDCRVAWAGFAHKPCDARSACVAAFALDKEAPHQAVMDRRLLGAPVVFAVGPDHYEVWRPGRDQATAVDQPIPAQDIAAFVHRHREDLTRDRLYQAKTRGRLESEYQLPLFVDPGVLLYAESMLGDRLTEAVVNAVGVLHAGKTSAMDFAFKAAFRLLAAKILKDKRVPGFIRANLLDVDSSLQRVEKHYGSSDPLIVTGQALRKRLVEAAMLFNALGDLRNLTTEALADVYERVLIADKDARKIHGTHKTPAYLVDYVVWRLADWIAEIPPDRLRVFEPASGHAPFLVAAIRLLRTLNLSPAGGMSEFLRERLVGIETDAFALEIARLSLTIADEPNPDGWDGVKQADMLAADYLEATTRTSTVLLTNPPYEQGKAEKLLERTLPHLPAGAAFGAVVPATILFSNKKGPTRLREWLTAHCQLDEVSLFPDGIFDFADQECTILLGRRLPDGAPTGSMRTRLRRVREDHREGFQKDYKFTTSRIRPQARFSEQPDSALWVPEFDEEIWSWLHHLPKLESIAEEPGKGVEYKTKKISERTIEDKAFPGSVEGFNRSEGKWGIHEHPSIRYFNLDIGVIRRSGTGTACVPQVLVNYAPSGRGAWRLRPFIDPKGRAFTSRFVSVRPMNESCPLEFLWAVCNSPLAHFYVFTHMLKRDVRISSLRRMPVIPVSRQDIHRVSRLARRYLKLASRGPQDTFNKHGYSDRALYECLRALDAEILRLYDLPAQAERLLLDQFAGEQRPGVPVPFTRYYPLDFDADVPLYAYLSESFQRALRGESPELFRDQERQYERLVAQADAQRLTNGEAEALHRLQAEVDGRDYALQMKHRRKSPKRVDSQQTGETEMKRLADRLASATLTEGRHP